MKHILLNQVFNISLARLSSICLFVFFFNACSDVLDLPPENQNILDAIDYTSPTGAKTALLGAYEMTYTIGWEVPLLVSVRGDDVNSGGKGDQPPFTDIDNFTYDRNYWMLNSLWSGLYADIYGFEAAIAEFEKYKEGGTNPTIIAQYTAEVKVLQAWNLLHLTRSFGPIFLPKSADPSEQFTSSLSTKEEVMRYIQEEMTAVSGDLLDVHPRDYADIPGGVTKYTALALKAIASLELADYNQVAMATSEIINSQQFALHPDFYSLFQLPGKLNRENVFEYQFSDFGQGSGPEEKHLWSPYGSQNWTPAKAGANSGWGFYEPSFKWIKFMLDRGDTSRLLGSVLFTNRGIQELGVYTGAAVPSYITNTTRSGDVINDYERAFFASGKHYWASTQLTDGRTDYGSNKNFICIRYADILLMHAEALLKGATGNSISALEAINLVRSRANMNALTTITEQDIIDERYAEFALEWGMRYADLIRLKKYEELSYDGRTFSEDDIYFPYPLAQTDLLPNLKK